MEQGRIEITDVVSAVKTVGAGAATGTGIAVWIGIVLPLYIKLLTAFTLTCTAVAFVYRFVLWVTGHAPRKP